MSTHRNGQFLKNLRELERGWDIENRQELRTLAGSCGTLALSPDGRLLLAGSSNGSVQLWNLNSWQSAAPFKGHTQNVTGVAFSPDGNWAASSSDDKTIRIWRFPVIK